MDSNVCGSSAIEMKSHPEWIVEKNVSTSRAVFVTFFMNRDRDRLTPFNKGVMGKLSAVQITFLPSFILFGQRQRLSLSRPTFDFQ